MCHFFSFFYHKSPKNVILSVIVELHPGEYLWYLVCIKGLVVWYLTKSKFWNCKSWPNITQRKTLRSSRKFFRKNSVLILNPLFNCRSKMAAQNKRSFWFKYPFLSKFAQICAYNLQSFKANLFIAHHLLFGYELLCSSFLLLTHKRTLVCLSGAFFHLTDSITIVEFFHDFRFASLLAYFCHDKHVAPSKWQPVFHSHCLQSTQKTKWGSFLFVYFGGYNYNGINFIFALVYPSTLPRFFHLLLYFKLFIEFFNFNVGKLRKKKVIMYNKFMNESQLFMKKIFAYLDFC